MADEKDDRGTELFIPEEPRPPESDLPPSVDDVQLKYFGAEMNIIKSPLFIGDRKVAHQVAIEQHESLIQSIKESPDNKEKARFDANYENKFFNQFSIEVERDDGEGGKHSLKTEVVVVPDATLGYPSAFDWIVLRNFEEIASRHIATNGEVPEWITFRIKEFSQMVYGKEKVGGRDIKAVEASLSRFRRTRIKSKWMWRNKGKGDWISTSDQGITIFNRVHRNEKRTRSKKNRSGDWCVLLDPLYRKSLNDHYYLIYDKQTFRKLSGMSDLAKLMYEKFYLHFMNMEQGQEYVLKRYASLCDTLFIKKRNQLSLAKQQMGKALDELCELGLLHWEMYLNPHEEIIIKTYPGSLFTRLKRELSGKSLADLEDPRLLTDGINDNRQMTLFEAGISMGKPVKEPENAFNSLLSKISMVTNVDYKKIEQLVKPLKEDYQSCLLAAQAGIEYMDKLEKAGQPMVKVKILASAFKERWLPSKIQVEKKERPERIKNAVKSLHEQAQKSDDFDSLKIDDLSIPFLKSKVFNFNNQKLRIAPMHHGGVYFYSENKKKMIEIDLNKRSEVDFLSRIIDR
jgi:hypothetical protein